MKLSNRILGILLLSSIIGAFYIFYKVFFNIKLTSLEISSNVENFSGSLENIKFSKEFFCKQKKCIISNIPPFDFKLKIEKKDYNNIYENIDLNKINKKDIYLEKKVLFKKIEKKQISKIEEIKESLKNKIEFGKTKQKYFKIYNKKDLVYFQKNDKLNFYNLQNNYSFSLKFKPKINYIKNIDSNRFIINTKVGSFTFNKLNKKIEYFSLFSDYILINNKYIGIINTDDNIRIKNFDLQKGNYIISYDIKTKKRIILKTFLDKIDKIYLQEKNLFVEIKNNKKFEIQNF